MARTYARGEYHVSLHLTVTARAHDAALAAADKAGESLAAFLTRAIYQQSWRDSRERLHLECEARRALAQ